MRTPDAEPTLAEFEDHLELAMRGGVILCTLGWTVEVREALDAVARAAPHPTKHLLDVAMGAFLRQVADPRPWYQQGDQED